ncbi:hypothetical protein [Vibrio aphrogenes]|nr:hypothetical protein [Vibrio aphrogenes]
MKTFIHNMRLIQEGFYAALYFSGEHDTHYYWSENDGNKKPRIETETGRS